jgi:pimeloyl-ACP methyl ester carboxylesterase
LQIEWLTVDGRRVRYRRVPPAKVEAARTTLDRPLLLIHGLAGSSDVWLRTLHCLADEQLDQPVVAPDMPGYGESWGPPGAMGIEALAEWTTRFLDALAIPAAHVAAHSMGCQVALPLAGRYPKRVGCMALTGPTTGRRLMPVWRYALGLANTFREPLSYKPTALRLYRQMGFRRYVATVREMLEHDPLLDIHAVKAPCLVVCGEWDAIIPAAVARALAGALPCGRFVSIPRAGHVVPYHQPAAFTRALLEFLTGARQPHTDLSRSGE